MDDMIFVSYSWINEEPDPDVLKLVNRLRENGYNAVCDVFYMQQESAMNFPQMMATSLRNAEKVIIILSEKYKEKADSFSSGVGKEYRYIINDIEKNKSKYILFALHKYEDMNAVTPDFLTGREYISYAEEDGWEKLLRKLIGTPKYIFAPVNSQKTLPEGGLLSNEFSDCENDAKLKIFCDNKIAFYVSYYDELYQGPLNQLMAYFTIYNEESFKHWQNLSDNDKMLFLYRNLKNNFNLILGASPYKGVIRYKVGDKYYLLGSISMFYKDEFSKAKFYFPKSLVECERSTFEVDDEEDI